MADYELYYWSAPFRGQFIRAILAFAGKAWSEAGDDAVLALMKGSVEDMPAAFMGPPLLIDRRANVAIAQTPAIALYLGETLGLLPATAALRAQTIKVVSDANDVIDEITLDGGREMWSFERWRDFRPRLSKWMSLWEETGRRHGLEPQRGYLLGGGSPGVADIVTATLWSTLWDRFPQIGALLTEAAPMTAALSRRMAGLSPLAELAAKARRDYGAVYCGGQIEASLRTALEG
jgi:glutathione S-transferase